MFGLTLSDAAKDLIINIINIVVLFIIVKLLVYKPVKKFLNDRTERINAQKEEAKQLFLKAQETLDEHDKIIEEAKISAEEESKKILLEANENAAKIGNDAEKRAKEIIKAAKEDAEIEHKRAIENAKADIGDIAVGVSKSILSREITADDREKLVDEFLNSLEG